MRKYVVVLALFLVLALTVPTFANSFADVSSNHWAYEAINELVAVGLIQGYPDGTFKGQNDLTRYEIAVMIARLLNDIDETNAQLIEQVDFMANDVLLEADSGLSEAEAEDVQTILEAVIAKNTDKEIVVSQTLSAGQAGEVMTMIGDLASEFNSELADLGVKVDRLSKDVADLKEEVAEESPIKFSGSVDTIYQVADYGDNPGYTAVLWADEDALDEDDGDSWEDDWYTDLDDMPAVRAFYQEYSFSAAGSFNEFDVDLSLNTYRNVFTETDSVAGKTLGEFENSDNSFSIDDAWVTVSKGDYSFRAGDLDDFDVTRYFIDDEDIEGAEIVGLYAGIDFRAFVIGYDAEDDNDYYGITASTDLEQAKVTGKVFHAKLDEEGEEVSNFAVEAESDITDLLSVKGELVFNSVKNADTTSTLFNIAADYALSDVVVLRAGFETVGEEFRAISGNLDEDNNYDTISAGLDYQLNGNNTISVDLYNTDSKYITDEEDSTGITFGLDNTIGAFTNTASVTFAKNDYYYSTDDDSRVIKLGTSYAMNDKTSVDAKIVNKSEDLFDEGDMTDASYTYIVAGVNHKFNDNIVWDTELQYITGEVTDASVEYEAEGNALTSQISVSF